MYICDMDKEIKAKELIKFSNLSLLLSGNDNSIRKRKTPIKYKEKVNKLINLIDAWIDDSIKIDEL